MDEIEEKLAELKRMAAAERAEASTQHLDLLDKLVGDSSITSLNDLCVPWMDALDEVSDHRNVHEVSIRMTGKSIAFVATSLLLSRSLLVSARLQEGRAI